MAELTIEYTGKTYTFDLDEITTKQARVIKVATGLTIMGLQRGMMELDPVALVGVMWYMKTVSGEACNIRTLDFKIGPFAEALNAAIMDQLSDEDKAEIEDAIAEGRPPELAPKDE